MEELSTAVQPSENDELLQEKDAVDLTVVRKKEKSQWSLFQLYMVCAEKICSRDL
jgi:hypothetical protein